MKQANKIKCEVKKSFLMAANSAEPPPAPGDYSRLVGGVLALRCLGGYATPTDHPRTTL